jgi:hypothetical protein
MKLFIMHFPPTSYYFIPLGPNILLRTLFSNTLSICSLNVKDQISHPQKTISKIIVFYILIFMISDRRGENRSFFTEW